MLIDQVKVTVGQTFGHLGHLRHMRQRGRGERLQPKTYIHGRGWTIGREVGSDIYDFHAEVGAILPIFEQNQAGQLLREDYRSR